MFDQNGNSFFVGYFSNLNEVVISETKKHTLNSSIIRYSNEKAIALYFPLEPSLPRSVLNCKKWDLCFVILLPLRLLIVFFSSK